MRYAVISNGNISSELSNLNGKQGKSALQNYRTHPYSWAHLLTYSFAHTETSLLSFKNGIEQEMKLMSGEGLNKLINAVKCKFMHYVQNRISIMLNPILYEVEAIEAWHPAHAWLTANCLLGCLIMFYLNLPHSVCGRNINDRKSCAALTLSDLRITRNEKSQSCMPLVF